MPIDRSVLVYLAPLFLIWGILAVRRWREDRKSRALHEDAVASGQDQPSSLHPIIDASLCLGCGACVRACPEGRILGLVDGKARLLTPADCIGHGACRAACPHGAISLVFGTEQRGVELPQIGPDFQTNVAGIYIAGELGGMGLIRNAIEQGRQAMSSIRQCVPRGDGNWLDVIIVGGGPAGISASLAAIENKLRYVTLEQESFGGTVAHFPKGKLVMTQPATLPLVGRVHFSEVRKEKLLAFWQRVARDTGLRIRYGERAEAVEAVDGGFEVRTGAGRYRARGVLLAIGRRGTPRKLDVPGEDLAKVTYRLSDPAIYKGKHVLVVGGGDSALEAACSLAEEPGTQITLSYRGDNFARAKAKNRTRVTDAVARGSLTALLGSHVRQISEAAVVLDWQGRAITLDNDAVVVCAGGILPAAFLKQTGIEMETKYGTA
ncbi:MAG: NAD(P)-binding domain-containing protein [Hyphomicrobiaceae bacterium]